MFRRFRLLTSLPLYFDVGMLVMADKRQLCQLPLDKAGGETRREYDTRRETGRQTWGETDVPADLEGEM